jgi:hypothetical protein
MDCVVGVTDGGEQSGGCGGSSDKGCGCGRCGEFGQCSGELAVRRIHEIGIAKFACSQIGQQQRSNNRLYSFPRNGPSFDARGYCAQLLARRSLKSRQRGRCSRIYGAAGCFAGRLSSLLRRKCHRKPSTCDHSMSTAGPIGYLAEYAFVEEARRVDLRYVRISWVVRRQGGGAAGGDAAEAEATHARVQATPQAA